MDKTQEEIITEQRGACGVITLNRPGALNALSLRMVTGIADILEVWRDNPAVERILMKGHGERAFCAGGDVKAAYAAGQKYKNGEISRAGMVHFFRMEYGLNRTLFHYPKPIISLMHGITMGGGYGLAGNGRYQVACENTVFAMPETAIGFFTDVGSVYHMQRCPGALGRYLALTGERLKAGDIFLARLATHCVPFERWADLETAVLEEGEVALKAFHAEPDASAFQAQCAFIDSVFDFENSAEDIFEALQTRTDDWAVNTLKTLHSRSPTSIQVCDLHFQKARGSDFDPVIERDFTLVQNFMEGSDFYEGVRALLIDKDHVPAWEAKTLRDVSSARIETLFREADEKLY